ncbi:MAG: PAS domain S-box protein [Candidatus Thorarchaeota archaeon]
MQPKQYRAGENTSLPQATLERSEILDRLGIPYMVLDLSGKILLVNETFRKTVLADFHDPVVGADLKSVGIDKRVPQLYNALHRIIQSSETVTRGEATPVETSAGRSYIFWRIARMRMEPDLPVIVAVGEDVTEMVRVKQESERLADRYHSLLEALPVGVVVTDFEDNIIMANTKMAEILGVQRDEIMGTNFEKYVIDEDRPVLREETRGRKRGRASTYDIRIRRPDGETRYLQIRAVPKESENGEPSSALAVIADITEQKRARKALEEEREKLRAIAFASIDAIVIVDNRATVTFWNRAAERMFGVSEADAIRKNMADIIIPENRRHVFDERFREISQQVEDGGITMEARLQRANGELFPVELFAGRVSSGADMRIVALIRDISERKIEERRRQQQHKELQLYASILRHDLKNDVSILLSNIDLARALLDAGKPDEIEEVLSSSEAVCNHMTNVLKAFGRPSDHEVVDLIEIVRESVTRARRTYKSLEIDIAVPEKSSPMQVIGSTLLPMVIENLIGNAVFHSKGSVRVTIRVERTDGTALVHVSDNGPGIPPRIKERLFEQGVSTSGGGMGLCLSREIMRALGGDLRLESTEIGKGSTFLITVPLITP